MAKKQKSNNNEQGGRGRRGGRSGRGKSGSKSLLSSVSQKLPSTVSRMGSMSSMSMNNMNAMNNEQKINNVASPGGTVFMIIALIIGLTINISALMWINKLEEINCACSEHWMRTYIKYYLYVLIPLSIINAILTIYRFNSPTYNETFYNYYRIFTFIFGFFGFMNIFIAVIFINKLKEINCVCSEDIKREVYWIYNIILLAIISINLLLALIMLPFLIGMIYKK
jgi:hypothetical protein